MKIPQFSFTNDVKFTINDLQNKQLYMVNIILDINKKLEEYCNISGLSKTAVVEKAVERYVDENLATMKEIANKKAP